MNDYYVTVCADCKTASCWHGEFMCDTAKTASTVDIPESELRVLGLEHSDNYSRAKVQKVCGSVIDVLEATT